MRKHQPAAGRLWAGVDVGTQSLRVLLVDGAGTVAGHGSQALTSRRTGDRHEQDPTDWWAALGTAFRRALRDVEPTRVGALAICGTSGTFLLAGPDGAARTPALMYDDARAQREAEDVAEAGTDVWAALGYATQPSWALPKLLWLLRHGPAELRTDLTAGRLALRHCGDYLAARLTGSPVATDWSTALKTGYDPDGGGWPTGVLDTLGIPSDTLPRVVRPGTRIGSLDPTGAAHTGLPVGVPVRAGMTDGCAAQIAAGALDAGSWNSVLGTTLVLKGVTPVRLTDPVGAVYSHRHPDGGWLPGGASNVGAGALEARFPGVDRAGMDRAAAGYEPAGGLVYPLRSPGERFPFVRPAAEPFEVGTFADDADRYAAVLQGVAYVERLCYAHLRRLGADVTGPLSLTGGATRSRYWCQLRADVLGREVTLPRTAEPAFGMAVLAAAGDDNLTATARRMVRVARVLAPRPGTRGRFAEPYARFVDALAVRGHVDEEFATYAKELS
ncbi:FGGY-family carbohydrate kinase [Plantactinospora solaniradicis]|uniref:FGGY-family carbohydrate kinase n=1 Tax=Plantactinospora solaniradicis TaxID=1723736 RepID=A0ABW1K769_9ACTN